MIKMFQIPGITVATDVILEYEKNGIEGLLLIQRRYKPYGLAIAGGKLEEDLTLKANAVKEISEEVNVSILEKDLVFFKIYDDVLRDPRGRVLSAVYTAKAQGPYHHGDDAAKVHFFAHENLERMLQNSQIHFAFDHRTILQDYYSARSHHEAL